ncbi:glucosyltransferase domain-containing protein [Butyrivibrio sp. WCD3002]|uniref:glucosyltransferase domain-containing protein n=1 Tax=Butyrivibrio sp. WCD3002 TaxID=1280676 RepID=UPI0003FF2812|nr:glucosyltransferase domain-containing protein [Butyrivibrio sp. WCD3002]
MEHIDRKFSSDDKRIFIVTALMMVAIHGFAFTNLMYSHDSLNTFYTYYAAKVDLGRWLYPLVQNIREVATPWMMGVFSVVYVSLAVVFVVRLLRFDKLKGICVSVLFASNITLIALFCTYSFDADADCLALLLSCLAAYSFDRYEGKKKIILSILFIVCTLALYQAYICVTIGLFLFVIIYESNEANDNQRIYRVVMTGGKEILILMVSSLIYGVGTIIAAGMYSVNFSNDYNGPGKLATLGIKDMVSLFPRAYGSFLKRLLLTENHGSFSSVFATVILLLLIALYLLLYARIVKGKTGALGIVIACLFIMPVALNVIYVISFGVVHELMIFSYCIFLLTPLVFDELLKKYHIVFGKNKNLELSKILFVVTVVCLSIIGFNNTVFANEVYTNKKLVYDNTLLHAQKVWEDVNSLEEYVEGETPVIFLGEFKESKAAYKNSLMTKYKKALLGSDSSSITYEDCIILFYKGILGRNMVIEHFDSQIDDFAQIDNMPSYPSEGYCKYFSGKVIVKMSELEH